MFNKFQNCPHFLMNGLRWYKGNLSKMKITGGLFITTPKLRECKCKTSLSFPTTLSERVCGESCSMLKKMMSKFCNQRLLLWKSEIHLQNTHNLTRHVFSWNFLCHKPFLILFYDNCNVVLFITCLKLVISHMSPKQLLLLLLYIGYTP